MIVTAKKDRKCDHCEGMIKAGERYQAIKVKKTVGYRWKIYHLNCYDKYNEGLVKSNVLALREMSQSARNLNRIRSDNE